MFSLTLGVSLAAVASLLFNLGLVLQKQGARRQRGSKRLSAQWIAGFLTSRRWWAGTSITLVGYCCELASFSLAPFALVQPVFTAGLSTLAVLSVVVGKERFSRLEWAGVVLAVAGASMVVLTARPATDAVSFEKISWTRLQEVLVFSAAFGSTLFVLGLRSKQRSEVILGLASGVSFTGAEVLTKVFGIQLAHGPGKLSFSVFGEPRVWAVLVGLLFFGLLGTYFLQVGFEHGRALIVGGVMGLSADMLPLFSGVVVFGEQLSPGVTAGALRLLGITLAFAGASVAAFSKKTEHLLETLENLQASDSEDHEHRKEFDSGTTLDARNLRESLRGDR